MVSIASPKQKILLVSLLFIVVCSAVYAAWYSYDRHDKLVQAEMCNDMLANPPKPTIVTGPDGNPAPLYSLNGCVTVVVPPSLWDMLHGHLVFENVPQRMKVNPYSFTDILLGRYTFGPTDIGCDQSATTTDCSAIGLQNPPPPSWTTADQVIVTDTNPLNPAPAGYQAFQDLRHKVTFNAPVDWKPQVLPEGDGEPSMVSPDFANPLGNMQGAYVHYYSASLPDGFSGRPAEYLVLLKQGMKWSDTTLDGHAAYITKMDNGFAMVVSQFSDNWFVTINFYDSDKKYGSVFDEFTKSFHAH